VSSEVWLTLTENISILNKLTLLMMIAALGLGMSGKRTRLHILGDVFLFIVYKRFFLLLSHFLKFLTSFKIERFLH